MPRELQNTSAREKCRFLSGRFRVGSVVKRDESACVHKYGKDAEKRSAGPDDEGDFDE